MLNKEKIFEDIKIQGRIKTIDLAKKYGMSRQYANSLARDWVESGKLRKVGSTRNAFYVTPELAQKNPEIVLNTIKKRYKNKSLEEHKVIDEVEARFPALARLKKTNENIHSIFYYAFSEMLNNAIEHSKSDHIDIEVALAGNRLNFVVNDYGIGVYKNIMKSRGLKSELEAIQDLLKGKVTTVPHAHSGEGIFFTSKVADIFILDSFGYQLIINNRINDVFLIKPKKVKAGTKVSFSIDISSGRHLNDVFRRYTETTGSNNYGFDKTEIKVKLYTLGGVHVSRSQARRVMSGLEKFKSVTLDFDKVPTIGQAFADEIFRVFKNRHPEIKVKLINMVEAVKFMVDRVEVDGDKGIVKRVQLN